MRRIFAYDICRLSHGSVGLAELERQRRPLWSNRTRHLASKMGPVNPYGFTLPAVCLTLKVVPFGTGSPCCRMQTEGWVRVRTRAKCRPVRDHWQACQMPATDG
jgi:hypothetical protein